MKIFNVKQIRAWDAFTIQNEPISSIDLMERAAYSCYDRIRDRFVFNSYAVLCGPGNNGGDGLVIARYLLESEVPVKVIIPEVSNNYSEDFKKNLARFPKDLIHNLHKGEEARWDDYDCIIDALFGSGLTRPIAGEIADLVKEINTSQAFIISVDIPSGLYGNLNQYPLPDVFVQADYTYTFQVKKSSFFNEEIRKRIGEIEVIDIGLLEDFSERESTDIYEVVYEAIELKIKPRFTHKFEQGFALIIGGSRGKFGAPILSAKAAMRTGAGLVSVAIPEEGRNLVHQSMNELMVVESKGGSFLSSIEIPEKVTAIGIGPGLDTNEESKEVVKQVFEFGVKTILDADALNLLSIHRELWSSLPENSIITPHYGEFQRLFGKVAEEQSKYEILKEKACEHRIYIILKGAITAIASPVGELYFIDEVGNSGMATAGSGDVLTGIITSLLAQGYSAKEASIYGVYVHAYAGDLSSEEIATESIVAEDIIQHIGRAIKNLTE